MTQEDPRILELRARREKARLGGGQSRIDRQHQKGKQTARERIDRLLDPGTFNELEPLVTHQGNDLQEDLERIAGDGVVTGYGQINGRTVYLYAQDFTVFGGALGEMQSKKICRVMDLAVENGAPIIGLIDSGGARIQEGVRALSGYAEIFKRNALYSGVVPQISVMLGPCAGGAAYSPAITDVVIMVKKQSYMFITGPQVIKNVTGEVIDVESLGGASVHASLSGSAHITTDTEAEALDTARKLLTYIPPNNIENPPFKDALDDPGRMDEALNHIVPLDSSEPYYMHDAIKRIIDDGDFTEIFPEWAGSAITGFAHIGGYSVGIVSQEPSVMAGVIDIDASDKIARFVRFCDAFNLPIVTFIDTPGFLPGVGQEHSGIIRHGAKALFAYAEATVPKISVITRKAYGGAYIVMSSKPLGSDVNYAWPSAEIAVMGAEGAVDILYRKQIAAADDPVSTRGEMIEEYREKFNNPYLAASLGFIDEVIEPRESRPKIIAALSALRDKHQSRPPRKHGNIPL